MLYHPDTVLSISGRITSIKRSTFGARWRFVLDGRRTLTTLANTELDAKIRPSWKGSMVILHLDARTRVVGAEVLPGA